ncbi:Na(+)-translocating NADH-quinone reductase subunit A [Cryomorphaceae bacterium 1068]|nr:Na(+)-translocating NADH-quinone reductase subunit A [Cryomorphaceae bacterium 1068]
MSKAIKIKKGADIKLIGVADKTISAAQRSTVFALKPDDFFGTIPKLSVKEGAEVKAGSPLFYDKARERVKFTSPVSGEVVEVKRGAKRKILEVKVLADVETRYETFTPWAGGSDREALVNTMLNMGLWPFVKQRPYGVIANPTDTPRDIFVSFYNSAPLAPEASFVLESEKENVQLALDALNLLTSGEVHVGVKAGDSFFDGFTGVKKHTIQGPHPAGNVGVLIHHVSPINKGEVVWTVNGMDMALIGKSLKSGQFRAERTVALVGSEVENPHFYTTMIGAKMDSILGGKLKGDNNRIINGDPLTGDAVDAEGHLGFYNSQITVLPEGDHKKFFLTEGWLAPGFNSFSLSKAFPSWLNPGKRYRLDTNLNGEERAFVVTGELEKVFPFDIYPMQLIKSIMVNDIDAMEKLGIYEVLPEDFALCEFACTSKVNIQQVVENGLADMRKEFES